MYYSRSCIYVLVVVVWYLTGLFLFGFDLCGVMNNHLLFGFKHRILHFIGSDIQDVMHWHS